MFTTPKPMATMCPDLHEYTFEASSKPTSKPTTKFERNSNDLPKIDTINIHSFDNTHTYIQTHNNTKA